MKRFFSTLIFWFLLLIAFALMAFLAAIVLGFVPIRDTS